MNLFSKKNIADIYPLSPLQQGMLFHSLYEPEFGLYFEQFTCVIEGDLDLKCIEAAWNYLVKSYPVFRTILNWKDMSQPAQIVLKERPITLETYDLKGLDDKTQQKEIEKFLKTDKNKNFDLARGPLLRISVLELSSDRYYFVWSYHHILVDGWCLSLIMTDLFSSYISLTNGSAPLPVTRPPYKNYISWLAEQDKDKADEFWKDYLKGFETPTQLPFDNPAARGLEFSEKDFLFSQDTFEKIENFAREKRTTPGVIIQGLWSLLLGRYSGSEDVVFGTTVSGRPPALKGAEETVGLFINTLPVRASIDENKSFIEFIDSFKEKTSEILNYEYSFLPEIKSCSEVPSNESLFNSLLVYENYPIDAEGFMVSSNMKILDVDARERTNFDITVVCMPGNGLNIRLMYNSLKFKESTILRMMSHLRNLVDSIFDNVNKPLLKIDMLTPEERKQTLIDFNNTAREFPKDKCVHELFEEQAAKYGDKDALIFNGTKMSYSQLNERANKIAHYLREHGVSKGTYVAIMVERSFDMLAGVLGIMKAGGAYVPIESEYPHERVLYMLNDIKGPVTIVHESFENRLSEYRGHVLCLDRFWKDYSDSDCSNPKNINSPEDIAYVIYTSGSTGNPKGVMVPHTGIARLVKNTNFVEITSEDKFLQVATFAFDAATLEFYGPLLNGGALYLAERDQVLSVDGLARLLIENDITILFLTTQLFNQLVDARPDSISKLKSLQSGGELHSIAHMKKALEYMKPGALTHVYGPTENTTYSSYCIVDTITDETLSVPIGKPLANSTMYILDKYMNPLPIGVVGEIYVGGYGIAKGYLNDPEKTEKSFVTNPIFDIKDKVLYKTGDTGKWLPDGNVDFIGRIDSQVKIRGHRIEPGEIETSLRELEEIKDAVVLAKDSGGGNKALIAYYVSDKELLIDELRRALKHRLPDYMIPNIYLRLDVIPVNENGKVDKKALPEPEGFRPELAIEYVAPSTELEKSIAKIWSNMLSIDKIGLYDNFFDLGGHSLKATQIISKINKELDYNMPLRAIFENPTISSFCNIISMKDRKTIIDIEPLPNKEFYELSHAQRRLWYIDKFVPNSSLYNITGAVMIDNYKIDVIILNKALQTVVNRHESMRTIFKTIDDKPAQVALESLDINIKVIDLCETEDQEVKLKRLIDEEKLNPFKLDEAPLFRLKVIKLAEEKQALLLNMNHIISDGWSMVLFVQELLGNYLAFKQGNPSPWPELEIQYRDFACWQNEFLEGDEIESQKLYWLECLSGDLPVLNLPTDFARPSIQTQNGSSRRLHFDIDMAKRIKEFARAKGVTTCMFTQSLFIILLYKLTGQDDIIIGSPIAGRNNALIEPLIGFFVNIQPIRSDLSGNLSFLDFLSSVKKTALNAYENQNFPFDKLVELLNPTRDMSRSPVFDVTFDYHEASSNPLINKKVGEISVEEITGEELTSKFDISVTGVEVDNGIILNFNFDTDLFEDETIERFMRYYTNILNKVMENPKMSLSQIDIMEVHEKNWILNELNDTSAKYPEDKTIHELFEEQVEKTPNNIALDFENETITYRELNDRSNRLARVLRDEGIKPDGLVAMIFDKSIEMIAGIFAVLKSGGAYLPIDPDLPTRRIKTVLEDSGALIILTQKEYIKQHSYSDLIGLKAGNIELNAADPRSQIGSITDNNNKLPDENTLSNIPGIIFPAEISQSASTSTRKVLYMDELSEKLSNKSSDNLNLINSPNDLAYVLYTSGSTGMPKGAMIEHENVVRLMKNDKFQFDFDSRDVWTMFHTYAFDFTIWEMFGALLYGGKLIIIPKNIAKDPEIFLKLAKAKKVTVLNQTPSAFYNLINAELACNDHDLSLKYVIFGGEALKPIKLKEWKEKYSEIQLINMYGITETTVHVTYKEITDDEINNNISNIGSPIPTLSTYVMDKDQNLAPIGVLGELCVSGRGVARGYLNRPELTKEKFLENPYKPGERLYRSGDLVKLLPSGEMVYYGRIDHQIQIRGFRVELGEIESNLQKHNAVKDVIVTAKEDKSEYCFICAYFVGERELQSSELREYLSKSLPDYMMPSYFVQMKKMPLTPNGKIDRKALPEPDVKAEEEYIAPRDEMEEKISEIWSEVLDVEQIGINDNFFDIGGHSLKVTQVLSRVKKKFGCEIPLTVMFEDPTIQGLSKAILMSGRKVYDDIEPLPKKKYYELSHAQNRLWYLDKVIPNSPLYNIPGAVLIDNYELDLKILEKAMQEVVNRHESLRTVFKDVDEKAAQIIIDSLKINIKIIDITDKKNQDKLLKKLIDEEKLTPFKLEEIPLFRVKVIKLSEKKCAMLLNMHHIISDGWSVALLARELLGNYVAFSARRPSPWPELEIQYKDFAHWQNKLLEGEEIEKQKEYWLKNLAGELPKLELPTDFPRPSIQTQNGYSRRMQIDADTAKRIKEFARSHGVTSFMFTQALFILLLYKITGQEDIIIGAPIAGRNNAQIESLIGFFVNIQPIRSNLSGNPKFLDFLQNVKQTALNAYENQDYPFDKLVEMLNLPRDLSRSPVFDVIFDYQESSSNPLLKAKMGGFTVKEIIGNELTSKFDLGAAAFETEEGITFTITYNTDLFNDETIERYLNYYSNILNEALDDPEKTFIDIEMIDSVEKNKVLIEFNDTASEFPKDKCAHELFEEIVKQLPNKDALVFGENSLTYSKLNDKSNKIARYLRDHGVSKGSYVAIMVERSFDMIAGILGIMKAGGAYVPVEAEYPRERVMYMIDEIQAPVVITHESLMDSISGYEGHVMCLESFWKESEAIDGSNLENVNNPNDIAYVIYTSGSTGKPKGVMAPHAGIVRLVKNTNFADFTPEDKILQIAAFAFDAATMEFYGSLLNGGTLYLASLDDVLSPDQLANLLIENDISIIFLTTQLFNQLIDARPDAVAKLKSLQTGGEAHSLAHMKKAFDYMKPGALTHVYGPTENTTYSSYYKVNSITKDAKSIPIGAPLANSTIYILDRHLKPAPVGVVGEIYLGGQGLASGYLNDPEKTANSFINNSMPEIDDKILYKTGDTGKWLSDGNVEFIGRVDYQVKIRGHRIELGEIETALISIENIKESVVLVKESENGIKTLIAYYVSPEETPVDQLRLTLKKKLPDYMIPNFFIALGSFPLNKNGKVDRSALKEPEGLRPELKTEYIEPENEVEKAIAGVWKDLLGVDKVGIYDNFFDLGGDSIVSLQVVNRLNQAGYKLSARNILQSQTIDKLAPIVEIIERIEVDQSPVIGDSPLTPIQKWFFEQDFANKNHFNQALLFKSSALMDGDILKKSLRELLNHHDILRSCFEKNRQEFKPISEEIFFKMKNINSEGELKQEAYKLQSSLDIKQGPLFGIGLYHLDQDFYIFFVAHHLIIDGVSWRILLEDLLNAYGSILAGKKVLLPFKTTSFRDWSIKLEEYARSADIIEEINFWKEMVTANPPEFPVDFDKGPNDSASIKVIDIELGEEATEALLKDAHRAYKTDINDLLITALMNSIMEVTGNRVVAFDMEGHGREDLIDGVDITRTVGWFTSMFPVILNSNGNTELSSRIQYVKEIIHNIPHKGFNFGILKYINDTDLSVKTDVSFNYLGQMANEKLGDSLKIETVDISSMMDRGNFRTNLIDIVCMVNNGCFRVNFIYSENKHKSESIDKLAALFLKELSEIIVHCNDPENYNITPSDFDLVDLNQDMIDKIADFD